MKKGSKMKLKGKVFILLYLIAMLDSLTSSNYNAIWELYKKYSMLSVWKSLRKGIDDVLLVYEGDVQNEETIELGEIKLKIDQKVKVFPEESANQTMRDDDLKKSDTANDFTKFETIRLTQSASISKRSTFCVSNNESTKSWNEFIDALISDANRDVFSHNNCL